LSPESARRRHGSHHRLWPRRGSELGSLDADHDRDGLSV